MGSISGPIGCHVQNFVVELVKGDQESASKMRLVPVSHDVAVVTFGGISKMAAHEQFMEYSSTADAKRWVRVDSLPELWDGKYPGAVVETRSATN